MTFASGKKAFGISDRSGFRYRLRDMRKEWTGALVGRDEYEEKHPQLFPPRVGPDPQALRDPRPPSPETLKVFVGIPLVEAPKLERPRLIGQVGQVTVGISDTGNVNVNVTGSSSSGSMGSVTVSTTTEAPKFDSTSITLDATTETFDEG